MYIFQPDRYLLKNQINASAHYVRGVVLDVGAGGNDRYSSMFKFEKYIKMDISMGPNVDVVGSAENIPFPENSFDSVVCTQVFEHLARPQMCAKEIYRVLKKDGMALITVPQMNELHEEPYDFFRYTKFGLEQMFRDVGFEIISVEQRGGFFSTMCQMLIRYFIDKFGLYKRKYAGRFFNYIAKFVGMFSIHMDKIDKSVANKKHTIGWCVVIKK